MFLIIATNSQSFISESFLWPTTNSAVWQASLRVSPNSEPLHIPWVLAQGSVLVITISTLSISISPDLHLSTVPWDPGSSANFLVNLSMCLEHQPWCPRSVLPFLHLPASSVFSTPIPTTSSFILVTFGSSPPVFLHVWSTPQGNVFLTPAMPLRSLSKERPALPARLWRALLAPWKPSSTAEQSSTYETVSVCFKAFTAPHWSRVRPGG